MIIDKKQIDGNWRVIYANNHNRDISIKFGKDGLEIKILNGTYGPIGYMYIAKYDKEKKKICLCPALDCGGNRHSYDRSV